MADRALLAGYPRYMGGRSHNYKDSKRYRIVFSGKYVWVDFSCDQAALWMVQSVWPSVRHTFFTMYLSSYHHELFRSYYHCRSDVHAKGQGQRRKVSATEVKTQFSHFRTVTPVWIHIWQWNDVQSLMWNGRGVLLFFKVIRQISRPKRDKKSSILNQIWRFRTVTQVWIHWWHWTNVHSLM